MLKTRRSNVGVCALAVGVLSFSLWAAAQVISDGKAPAPFCQAHPSAIPPSGPKLLPRDEAASRADLLAFRRQLQIAVARKDAAAILKIADPAVIIDFGGGEGIGFLEKFMNDPSQDFWGEFGRALAMGGTFDNHGDFSTPYVYSAWPDEFDAFDCMAVTARAVQLREKPTTTSRALARLDFDIVEWIRDEPATKEWMHVRLASGLTGYVASRFLRSPTDYRAWFIFTQDGWRLRGFVAGD
jgi:hypothetical protein